MSQFWIKLKNVFYGNGRNYKQLARKSVWNGRKRSFSEKQSNKDKENTRAKKKEDKMKKIIYAIIVFAFGLMFLLLFAGMFLYLFRSFFHSL
jgi:uncharacterized protein YqhQ